MNDIFAEQQERAYEMQTESDRQTVITEVHLHTLLWIELHGLY